MECMSLRCLAWLRASLLRGQTVAAATQKTLGGCLRLSSNWATPRQLLDNCLPYKVCLPHIPAP